MKFPNSNSLDYQYNFQKLQGFQSVSKSLGLLGSVGAPFWEFLEALGALLVAETSSL